ncbi:MULTISPECIES: LysR family transcriptional regulator [unclassified Pseudomonas]|uniref:LysR family transcriptional regulator n=1 Tax=unclassified Pseudomonas TaxID=196821 RepID=UPI0021C9A363|nr:MULTISPECIES: LysR family transcriptional regulator [unclassified Pseudomonas]MCU1734077.1 LysR family transcriptional regulator [Pseudomonas sp. 20P_3.2_Bac4]MCU1747275.1 LysR family transcriptional regulator [Pseudomonas sp. 20P_3.2_Bac5]
MNLLGLIKSFIKVVEAGSIAGGARSLGLSAAAVSQNIARLEAHLQVRLLARTTRSMVLTASGTLYYEKVRHIERDLEEAQQAVTTVDSEPQGRLCISTSSAFGRHVLGRLIPNFSALYPRLSIELLTSDNKVDHARQGVDVSIRITPQLEDGLLARHVAQVPFVCCASPGYLAREGWPQSPEELKQRRCLVFRYPVDGRFLRWGFVRDGLRFDAEFGDVLISDDIDVLAQMAARDGGVTRLAEFVARPYIERGELVRLFEDKGGEQAYAQTEPMDIYLCVTDRLAMTPKVRAFQAFLQANLGDEWKVKSHP